MRDHDAKVAAVERDYAKRERNASLIQSRQRAQEQVAKMMQAALAEVSRATQSEQTTGKSEVEALQYECDLTHVPQDEQLQYDDSLASSIASCSSNSSSSEHLDGGPSCSELLEALRSPREPGTAPWSRERDPRVIQAAARRIDDVKLAAKAASASGGPELKALAKKIVEESAVLEAREMVDADKEEALKFLLHEAELEALIVGSPTKQQGSSRVRAGIPNAPRTRPPWRPCS